MSPLKWLARKSLQAARDPSAALPPLAPRRSPCDACGSRASAATIRSHSDLLRLTSNRTIGRNPFAGSRLGASVSSIQPAGGGGVAAIIGMLNGRNICIVFTTLGETNDGIGGLLA